ncbi:MAG: 5-formyltetrahydrofolate cyclo-ligase [Myxococcales bacterium]|nr:5-formyltetrahydrofolate cyclo-ligase [Myxococcales bacterium]|tara:strand:- start:1535 stop:2110 length:576 start_codon:yes stop_codon:yes gene_type:complete
MDKNRKEIRAHFDALRNALSTAEQTASSEQLCRLLAELPEIQRATHVAGYFPVRGEIDVRPLLEELLQRGVQVYLPIIDGKDLLFGRITTLDPADLSLGPFGIPAPSTGAEPLTSLDAVLIPGVAFDHEGNRMGRGGGYFDRALMNASDRPCRIGVAYSCQIETNGLHAETHDVPMHIVMTNTGKIYPPGP